MTVVSGSVIHPTEYWHGLSADQGWLTRTEPPVPGQALFRRAELLDGLALTTSHCCFRQRYQTLLDHTEPVTLFIFGHAGVSRFREPAGGLNFSVQPGDVWAVSLPAGQLSRDTPAAQCSRMTVLRCGHPHPIVGDIDRTAARVRRLSRSAGLHHGLQAVLEEPLTTLGSRLRASGQLLQLLSALLDDTGALNALGQPLPGYLQRVCDHLQADLSVTPSLDALAALAERSHTGLNQAFRRHLGLSVFDWLRQQRLQRACHLLAYTDRPISDIALDCGFSHASHMASSFRAEHGMTPRAFRRVRCRH